MSWSSDDASRLCGDVLQSLINALPDLGWESADADGDDGIIYFTNRNGDRVMVKISREALSDYLEADEQAQYRKEQQLARRMQQIDASGEPKALVTSDDLAP